LGIVREAVNALRFQANHPVQTQELVQGAVHAILSVMEICVVAPDVFGIRALGQAAVGILPAAG
jgi:hypothetical protein